ncbi:MAG TPA: protein translocase subunit SecD [Gammaproteobacteria bacterium]|nr:protein translocase subunit SecD [Gammaproteobacteria bacterium]
MINQYPLWKYLLLVMVAVVAILYALPNLYGEDPAVQISARHGAPVNTALRDQVASTLKKDNLPYKSMQLSKDQLLVRFLGTDEQLSAADRLTSALGDKYVVALNLAPATPQWLRDINALPMYLGLDLRGGVHFLMEVDMKAAIKQHYERYVGEIRTMLRKKRIHYSAVEAGARDLVMRFRTAEARTKARSALEATNEYDDLKLEDKDSPAGPELMATLTQKAQQKIEKFALQQNITTLRNRVNELGVAEPVIQQQGDKRIVVELPGVQDTARAKEILGATATLAFHFVDEDHNAGEAASTGHVPAGDKLYQERNGNPILLKRQVILTGDYITDASSGFDQQTGGPAVFITLDGKGGHLMQEATRNRVGSLMAVVYIESKVETKTVNGKTVRQRKKSEKVINVARIREELGKRFQITGLDSPQEARNLALLLRAGALAAPVDIIEERTVGPSLGKTNIAQGFESVVVGFLVVVAFMAVYYKVFGLLADLALGFNLVLIVAILSMLQATLTLPGIAGIVLTVGMAVDANVLIYERIREELRNGNSPQASIHAGYEKAFGTIADANITTLIAALVLFSFGTGPVKGFAVTLSIGIITSMFTAIMGTRAIVNLIYGGRRRVKLAI